MLTFFRRVEVLEIQEERRPERVDRETSIPRSEEGRKKAIAHVNAATATGSAAQKPR